jgi:lantibiotic biosynthesis protein
MQTWDPMIRSNVDSARAIGVEVAHRLLRQSQNWSGHRDPSLAGGDAGLAVLFGYLDRCFPSDGWEKRAHGAVSRMSKNINAYSARSIGLFGGLAGLAFATWYLSHGDTRYCRARSAVEDELLPRALAAADSLADKCGMPVEDYDLISGLSGVAAYLLCRTRDNRALLALTRIIDALVKVAERDTPNPAWYTPADLISTKSMIGQYPNGILNCGLAHGVPGILTVLALAYRENIAVPHLRPAIERLARWLANQRRTERWGDSWPAAVAVGAPDITAPAPVGWCYGNPGVARALWLAGNVVDDDALCETAIEALKSGNSRLKRRADASPTFCHGAAGRLQITMRFASETRLLDFADAACRTLDQLVARFSEDAAFGYRDYNFDTGPEDRTGVLDGAAGVALVLLAAASSQDPGWDRIFLLS